MTVELKSLPPLRPPRDLYPHIHRRVRLARLRRVSFVAALALAAAVASWPRSPDTVELLQLRSVALESTLHALAEPVLNLDSASYLLELEEQLASVDQALSAAAGSSERERAQLWRTRVELLEALVRARGEPPPTFVTL
jgi:hypothetical protein